MLYHLNGDLFEFFSTIKRTDRQPPSPQHYIVYSVRQRRSEDYRSSEWGALCLRKTIGPVSGALCATHLKWGPDSRSYIDIRKLSMLFQITEIVNKKHLWPATRASTTTKTATRKRERATWGWPAEESDASSPVLSDLLRPKTMCSSTEEQRH